MQPDFRHGLLNRRVRRARKPKNQTSALSATSAVKRGLDDRDALGVQVSWVQPDVECLATIAPPYDSLTYIAGPPCARRLVTVHRCAPLPGRGNERACRVSCVLLSRRARDCRKSVRHDSFDAVRWRVRARDVWSLGSFDSGCQRRSGHCHHRAVRRCRALGGGLPDRAHSRITHDGPRHVRDFNGAVSPR